MEYEQINEDTIRVMIKHADLKEHGLSLVDFLRNRQNVEHFFHQILDEIEIDTGFQETEAVTFQIVPNRDGLELYICKGEHFHEELLNSLAEELAPLDEDSFSELTEGMPSDQSNQWRIKDKAAIQFGDFEHLIQLAQNLQLEAGRSSLYARNGQYFLVLTFFTNEMRRREAEEEVAIALEYGQKSKWTPAVIEEHAKPLIKDQALEEIRHQFL